MSGKPAISRRAFAGTILALGLGRRAAWAQGFAGLGTAADGFAEVVPGRHFAFPADHGPHPDFRIEWWYVTANLVDAAGAAHGIQWTLFRQAMRSGPPQPGWANQQIWMGHAAVTRADTHRYGETFARGGVGQAGVEATPFHAWIDSWDMRGLDGMRDRFIAPLELKASGADFGYTLRLDADRPLVLQGVDGYSRKSQRGQASYYFSQPFFRATGSVTIDDKAVAVTGQAWMDREWSSQPLSPDQKGWDWFSLHLSSGEKLMLFRLRGVSGRDFIGGNWIDADGATRQLAPEDVSIEPLATTTLASTTLPTRWRVTVKSRALNIETIPLNPASWMGTRFAYWEGPIRFTGTHGGEGYLEMTGY